MNEQSIQEYFHFDEADLQSNRQGNLSQRQRDRLLKNSRISSKWGAIFGMLLFGLAISLMVSIGFIIFKTDGALEKVIWAGVIGFFAMITLVAAIYSMSRMFKKVNLKLEKVEGQAKIVTVQATDQDLGRVTVSTMYIGEQEFSVSAVLANCVTQGDDYTVFFVRDSHNSKKVLPDWNIVSMEMLQHSG